MRDEMMREMRGEGEEMRCLEMRLSPPASPSHCSQNPPPKPAQRPNAPTAKNIKGKGSFPSPPPSHLHFIIFKMGLPSKAKAAHKSPSRHRLLVVPSLLQRGMIIERKMYRRGEEEMRDRDER